MQAASEVFLNDIDTKRCSRLHPVCSMHVLFDIAQTRIPYNLPMIKEHLPAAAPYPIGDTA